MPIHSLYKYPYKVRNIIENSSPDWNRPSIMRVETKSWLRKATGNQNEGIENTHN